MTDFTRELVISEFDKVLSGYDDNKSVFELYDNGALGITNAEVKVKLEEFRDETKTHTVEETQEFFKLISDKEPLAFTKLFRAWGQTDPAKFGTQWLKQFVATNVPATGDDTIDVHMPAWLKKDNSQTVQSVIDHPFDSAWGFGKQVLKFVSGNIVGTTGTAVTLAGASMLRESPVLGMILIAGGLAAIHYAMSGHDRSNGQSHDTHGRVVQNNYQNTVDPRTVTVRTPAGAPALGT